MPKSRGSGTIASGGGQGSGSGSGGPGIGGSIGGAGGAGGAGSPEELAQRLLDRLTEARSVNVPVYSRSRRGTENVQVTFDPMTPGTASVDSESGSTYQVDYNDDTCTCPHHRIRGERCRHIDAVHQAMGRLVAQVPGMPASVTAANIDQAVRNRQQLDRVEEAERQNIIQVEEDDGFFYTENDEEFERTLERVRNEPLQYEYENVLNGSQATFGLEIEFADGDADAIARELYDLGICGYNRRAGYHSASVPGKWKLEWDSSVCSGSQGGELVSPVLRDTPETWRNIEKICEVAKRHGARINYKCGGHVHVGMEPLDEARQRWRRFFRTIGGFEDVMYRLAGGTEGRIRSGYTHYATPFANRAREAATARMQINDTRDVINLATTTSNYDRYQGINLTNIYDSRKPNTVEFRYFNSSLSPAQLQANIKLANGIMMAAEKARTKDAPDSGIFPTETMKKRGSLLREHSMTEDNRRNHAGIKKLVDILFTRKKDKDNILSVYAKNDWAR